jgi:hypothetical protein
MNQNFAAIILGGTGQVGGAAVASEPTAKPLIAHFCPLAKLTGPYQ